MIWYCQHWYSYAQCERCTKILFDMSVVAFVSFYSSVCELVCECECENECEYVVALCRILFCLVQHTPCHREHHCVPSMWNHNYHPFVPIFGMVVRFFIDAIHTSNVENDSRDNFMNTNLYDFWGFSWLKEMSRVAFVRIFSSLAAKSEKKAGISMKTKPQ